MRPETFQSLGTVVDDTGYARIHVQKLGGLTHSLIFQVSPTGITLNGFKVRIKTHPNGEWIDYLADADFAATTIQAMLWSSTVEPQSVADGQHAGVAIDVNGAYFIEFLAKATAGSGTVDILGTLKEG